MQLSKTFEYLSSYLLGDLDGVFASAMTAVTPVAEAFSLGPLLDS